MYIFTDKKAKTLKKGHKSGCISVYFKTELKQYISIVEQNKHGIKWLKIKNDILHLNEDIYICLSYIPPVSSKVMIEHDFDFFEEIEKGIEKHRKNGKTFIVGDLNSCTGQLNDIMESDKYLDETLKDEQNDIFDNTSIDETTCPKRNNSDHVIDNNGKKLISMCKATDHIIANGRLHSDKNVNFTFFSQRGLSVTDYLVLNKNDIISLHDFKILEWSHFSDHAAVYFTFNMQCINDENSSSNCLSDQRLIFNEEEEPEFKELLKNTIHSISNENISKTNAVLQVKI